MTSQADAERSASFEPPKSGGSSGLAALLRSLLPVSERSISAKSIEEMFTPRERQVLELIGRSYDNHAIAEELGISPETVKAHTYRIRAKLRVRTRNDIYYWFLKNGWH